MGIVPAGGSGGTGATPRRRATSLRGPIGVGCHRVGGPDRLHVAGGGRAPHAVRHHGSCRLGGCGGERGRRPGDHRRWRSAGAADRWGDVGWGGSCTRRRRSELRGSPHTSALSASAPSGNARRSAAGFATPRAGHAVAGGVILQQARKAAGTAEDWGARPTGHVPAFGGPVNRGAPPLLSQGHLLGFTHQELSERPGAVMGWRRSR